MPLPTVAYDGTNPDPVEWANDFVKPLVDDLDTRENLMPFKANEIITPLGLANQVQDVAIPADRIYGCILQIDWPCSIISATIEVRSVAPASATLDLVLYSARTLALVGTFGSVAFDSTGKKTATPGSPLVIATPGKYLGALRPRVAATTGGSVRGYNSSGNGQSLSVSGWGDWDYPPESGTTWSVTGSGAAPASLASYTRVPVASQSPVMVLTVTP